MEMWIKIAIVVVVLLAIVGAIIAATLLMRNSTSSNNSFPELSEDPGTLEGEYGASGGEHGTSDDESGSGDASTPLKNQDADWTTATSIHQFYADDIEGNRVNLDKYKGQYLVVINMSSKAGAVGSTTDVNDGLKALYKERHEDGLKILAFWCKQFISEEESKEEFKTYVNDMEVKADLFAQVDVNGDSAHPLWKWLKQKAEIMGGIEDEFAKFLLDREGHFLWYLSSSDNAMSFMDRIQSS